MTALRVAAARLAAGMLAVVALAACGPPAGTLFHATLSSPDGSYSMPVTLGDTTGLVLSMEPTARVEWLGDQPIVTADPADPNVLILSWMGGACEDETVIGFWPAEDRFGMYVSPRGATPLFGGCPAIGLPRALRITLSAPVAPDRITFGSAA
jgi:hypothetical protein